MKRPQFTTEEIKAIKEKATEEFYLYDSGVSDLDMGFNPESGKYDRPAIEWECYLGRRWEYFNNEAERDYALLQHRERMRLFIVEFTRDEKKRILKARKDRRAKAQRLEKSRNTIGNIFPELASLK